MELATTCNTMRELSNVWEEDEDEAMISDLPHGTRTGRPYAKQVPPALKPPATPKSARKTTSFPPFTAISTPIPEDPERSAGKSTAPGAGDAVAAPQFVSLDQLAALLQVMNHPQPKDEKSSDEARTDRAIALAEALSKWLKASKPSNVSSDLNTAYSEMLTCLTEIKKHVGGITKDLVLALLLYQQCQPHFQAIANTVDSCIVVDASKPISSKTILELAGRFATAGAAAESSVFSYRSQRGPSTSSSNGNQQTGWKTMDIINPEPPTQKQSSNQDNTPHYSTLPDLTFSLPSSHQVSSS
ncbi:hypothetical protein PCASD_09138 [Puccinia coronata f. sp. avenae]|uniref:Uncharacterized protein n=1 Tax=Puccinia coronata f. sp. avenae TaxID=200324 RepID=A0A2N5V4G7_9BASI|nr:hypothetical protein PCASD_09138 [Puccinia coronata f. sp. avenae]